jgi:hypothetical protein
VAFATASSVIPAELLPRFRFLCKEIHAATILLLRRSRVRGFSVQMILTYDLAAEIERLRPSAAERASTFTTQRLSGTVVAKTLFPREDGEPYCVVVSDVPWAEEDGEDVANGIATLAHEFGHCAIECVRRASACAVSAHGLTSGELAAREIVRAALDEYRADLFEDLFLQALGDASEDGESEPLRLHHLCGRRFAEGLGEVLSGEVYPGWPDRVQACRDLEVALDVMWPGLVRSAWDVFVTIAHAGAVARTAEAPDPIAGEFATHPAVTLYLGEPWRCLLEIASAVRPVCSASAHAKMEARAFSAGVDALLGMWSSLGLRFALDDDGTCIEVRAPLRA